MKPLINYGVQVLRKDAATDEPITVIVIGMERSGTSMVAKMLENMGVYMGTQRDLAVYEDVEIANLLEQKKVDRQKLQSLINKRNETYGTWGFKRPSAINYIRKFEKYFRNIHYVVPFRDLMAIANRHVISVDSNLMHKMKFVNRRYTQIIKFIDKSKHPCMVFSYEKALVKDIEFITSLANFLNLPLSDDLTQRAKAAIQVDSRLYLKSTRTNRVAGNVMDVGRDGIVSGWAKQTNSMQPVSLEIWVNQKKVCEVEASDPRPDLTGQNMGDGRFGFRVDIQSHLEPGKINTVAILHTKDKMGFQNSIQSLDLTRD
ncbi:MAG: hypothetical protein JXR76_23435 [Deltaproteobacteria bacterium]|nr:hypothetical protein [Deltaproteobacteria bacterium]